MKNLLKKLFAPKNPILKPDDRIQLKAKQTGARDFYTDDYVRITKDDRLIFIKEKSNRLIFRVRTNYKPSDNYDVRDNEIIYFSKKNFKAIKYRKVRN